MHQNIQKDLTTIDRNLTTRYNGGNDDDDGDDCDKNQDKDDDDHNNNNNNKNNKENKNVGPVKTGVRFVVEPQKTINDHRQRLTSTQNVNDDDGDDAAAAAAATIKNRNLYFTVSKFLKSISDLIPARIVLYFLSWSGFLVSFMLRNDINIAIVVMVGNQFKSEMETNSTTFTNNQRNISSNTTTTNGNITSYPQYNKTSSESAFASDSASATAPSPIGEFDWSPAIQSIILSSFYWWYVVSQVVGGVATQYFGTKNVFGWSQLATAICTLGIPYASQIHYSAIIVLRSIQGFASGLTWPAMYAIVGYWIPSNERSRFMSSFQGFSIGIGLTYPICGFIIANWGWRQVFYTTGTIGCLWCLLWYLLAFNSPEVHPRITAKELAYIEANISDEIKLGQGMRVPWPKIFKSLPVWSIGITTFGRIWIHYQFIMSGPMYMKNVLHFEIQKNGLLTGTPFLLSYLSSVVFCWIADLMVAHNKMTLTNVRKLFTALSQIAPGILIVIIVYINDYLTLVLILWFIAVSLITASYAGAMANIVDIAPNLAGPVLAFAQTIHMTASFVSPLVTGFLVTDMESLAQWKNVFGLSAFIAVITYLVYQLYGTATIQKWNYPYNDLTTTTNRINGNQNNNNNNNETRNRYENDNNNNNKNADNADDDDAAAAAAVGMTD